MEKLIELLNEYNRNVLKYSDVWELKDSIDNPGTKYISLSSVGAWKIYLWIISREYGFIKWLVDNDKILETEVRPIQIYDYEGKYCDDEFGYSWFNQGLYYRVIMELAISDNPIEDLISYLK